MGNRLLWIACSGLIGLAVLFALLNIFLPGWTLKTVEPAVFFCLSTVFFLLILVMPKHFFFKHVFYIPAFISLAVWLIFLYIEVTRDQSVWSYGWLFCIALAGFGVAQTNRRWTWHPSAAKVGVRIGSFALAAFALFGALVGEPPMRILSPLILAGEGIILYRTLSRSKLNKQAEALETQPQVIAPVSSIPSDVNLPCNNLLPEPLSRREMEVLLLIEDGLSNQQIADRLIVAPSTVKTHINNIYAKLNVETRTQALKRLRELNLSNARNGAEQNLPVNEVQTMTNQPDHFP